MIIAKILFIGQIKYKPQGISNLVLAGGQAGFRDSESGAVAPQNQWAALRAAHQFVGQKSENQILEAWAGIEPARVGFADRSVTTSPPRQNSPVYPLLIDRIAGKYTLS